MHRQEHLFNKVFIRNIFIYFSFSHLTFWLPLTLEDDLKYWRLQPLRGRVVYSLFQQYDRSPIESSLLKTINRDPSTRQRSKWRPRSMTRTRISIPRILEVEGTSLLGGERTVTCAAVRVVHHLHSTLSREPAPHPGLARLVLHQLAVQPVSLPPRHSHSAARHQADPRLVSAGRPTAHSEALGQTRGQC